MSGKNDKILENIFGSKTKVKLLKLFLHNQQLVLGARDISKRIGAKERECEKVIKELLKIGILEKAGLFNKKKNKLTHQRVTLKG